MSCCQSCRGDETADQQGLERDHRHGRGIRPPLVFDHICGVIQVARCISFPAFSGTAADVSPAIRLGCASAATVYFSVFQLTGAVQVSIALFGSNDTESWQTLGSVGFLNKPGYLAGRFLSIGYRFVRLRYLLVGIGSAALAAGVHRWKQ